MKKKVTQAAPPPWDARDDRFLARICRAAEELRHAGPSPYKKRGAFYDALRDAAIAYNDADSDDDAAYLRLRDKIKELVWTYERGATFAQKKGGLARAAMLSPEQRVELARRAAMTGTPAERSARAKAAATTGTDAERSARAQAAAKAGTTADRRARAQKAAAARWKGSRGN